MTATTTRRRLLAGAAALVMALLVALFAARLHLTGLAVGAALREVGATEVSFRVAHVSLWRVVVEQVSFLVSRRPYAAERVSLHRAHWWMPSLGLLRVEEARVPVNVAELAKRPPPDEKPGRPESPPFEEISIDGQLIIEAAGLPDQALTVKIEAKPANGGVWTMKTQADGPGLGLRGEGRYDFGSGVLVFKVPEVTLELKPWDGFLRQLVPVPAGDWEMDGKFSGSAEGRWADGKLTAAGRLRLREGRVASTAKALNAEGIEADLEFTDLAGLMTKPGALRIRELRAGKLTLTDIAAGFALEGPDRIAVTQASLQTLGGRVTSEPFTLAPSRAEVEAVLLADGISIEQVMALTESLPAQATGRVNGRVPVRIDESGLKFGTGWLALTPGVQAELALNAKGLLTGGAAPGSPGYAVLQKVEAGLLKLGISELRLDIRPSDAPVERSARLHLKGAPLDPEVKAPITLDLNVNGPLEKLINMGMDSRLSVGTGK